MGWNNRLKVVTIGEVMLRLSVPHHERFIQADQFQVHYAGGEANVAVGLAQMGQKAIHVTCFPSNDLGLAARNELVRWGIEPKHIYFEKGRMGVYFLENGAMQRASSIIYDRSGSAFALWEGKELDWDYILDGADYFHWTGITPAISQRAADLLKTGLQEANRKGVRVTADINYRKNLFDYGKTPREILSSLIPYAQVIVGGISGIENATGIQGSSFEEVCRKVVKEYPNVEIIANTTRTIVSSSVNRLSGVLWNGQDIFQTEDYELSHIVDRIGGGDAFMAGLIYGLAHYDDQKAIEFATVAGVLKHSIPGDALLCSAEEIAEVLSGNQVGKLKR